MASRDREFYDRAKPRFFSPHAFILCTVSGDDASTARPQYYDCVVEGCFLRSIPDPAFYMVTEIIDKLKLYFDPEVDSEVEIKERVLSAYEKNRLFFGHSLTNKCEVRILYGRAEMDGVLGFKTEVWLVGTTTKDGIINIFSPKIFDKVSSHPSSNFGPVLTHELAHIFTNEISKFYQPVWLNEGLAGHIAEQYKNKQPKKLSDFEKLHNREDWNSAPNYAQAACFTSFLIEKLGKNEFLQFLRILSQNNDAQEKFAIFSELFTHHFNISFDQSVKEWQKKVLSQKISGQH